MTSSTSIISVGDLIDSAFYNPDTNTVNHKIIQTILIILARQLRILGRYVEVDINEALKLQDFKAKTHISVSEIKITAGDRPSDIDIRRRTLGSDAAKRSTSVGAKRSTMSDGAKSHLSTTSFGGSRIGKPSSIGAKPDRKDQQLYLSALEEIHEKQLRIINQRSDSHEEPEIHPTPMKSLSTLGGTKEEKLLIVERVPSLEKGGTKEEKLLIVERVPSLEKETGTKGKRSHTPRLSIVTKEEFAALEAAVKELQARFAPIGVAAFPENAELVKQLQEGASLTDAMAALQISARLEAAEKALGNMIQIVTELARNPPESSELIGKPEDISTTEQKRKTTIGIKEKETFETDATATTSVISQHRASEIPSKAHQSQSAPSTSEFNSITKPTWITSEELNDAIQDLEKNILKEVEALITRNSTKANTVFKNIKTLEAKLNEAMQLGGRMAELEALVSSYAEQINIMDTGLSSQMTSYQENLTQMQHELETGLEAMAEALVSASGDPVAVAELNGKLTSLQIDFDNTTSVQLELRNVQTQFSSDLSELAKTIEILRETKSDREEVADALRDKAGLGALNGLVVREQFDAVRGDLEKRIGVAYDKFNNQELVWQKAIDDLIRELNEKVEWVHVVALRDDINRNFNILKDRMKTLTDIVGEPRAFAISKKINRDNKCLSCTTPANISVDESGKPPALPAAKGPAVGAEAEDQPVPKESGDHGACYPGYPIPHKRDPRSHYCNRYCGGSHTKLNTSAISRGPPEIILQHLDRNVSTAVGSDGKTYMVDDLFTPTPCRQCNSMPKPTPRQPAQDSAQDSAQETSQDSAQDTQDAVGAETEDRRSSSLGQFCFPPRNDRDHSVEPYTESALVTPETGLMTTPPADDEH